MNKSLREIQEILWLHAQLCEEKTTSVLEKDDVSDPVLREEEPEPSLELEQQKSFKPPKTISSQEKIEEHVQATVKNQESVIGSEERQYSSLSIAEQFEEPPIWNILTVARILKDIVQYIPWDTQQLDIEKTIQKSAKVNDIFPVFTEELIDETSVLILEEKTDSMIPFRSLGRDIVQVFEEYLSCHRVFLKSFSAIDIDSLSIDTFRTQCINPQKSFVFIISDGLSEVFSNNKLYQKLCMLPDGCKVIWLHPWGKEYWGRTQESKMLSRRPKSIQKREDTISGISVLLVGLDATSFSRIISFAKDASLSFLDGRLIRERRVKAKPTTKEQTEEEKGISLFRYLEGNISPKAMQLLGIVAALPSGRINLPLLYILADEIVGKGTFGPIDVAQMFASGVLMKEANSKGERIIFSFQSDDIRRVFLSALPRSKIAQVLELLFALKKNPNNSKAFDFLGLHLSLLIQAKAGMIETIKGPKIGQTELSALVHMSKFMNWDKGAEQLEKILKSTEQSTSIDDSHEVKGSVAETSSAGDKILDDESSNPPIALLFETTDKEVLESWSTKYQESKYQKHNIDIDSIFDLLNRIYVLSKIYALVSVETVLVAFRHAIYEPTEENLLEFSEHTHQAYIELLAIEKHSYSSNVQMLLNDCKKPYSFFSKSIPARLLGGFMVLLWDARRQIQQRYQYTIFHHLEEPYHHTHVVWDNFTTDPTRYYHRSIFDELQNSMNHEQFIWIAGDGHLYGKTTLGCWIVDQIQQNTISNHSDVCNEQYYWLNSSVCILGSNRLSTKKESIQTIDDIWNEVAMQLSCRLYNGFDLRETATPLQIIEQAIDQLGGFRLILELDEDTDDDEFYDSFYSLLQEKGILARISLIVLSPFGWLWSPDKPTKEIDLSNIVHEALSPLSEYWKPFVRDIHTDFLFEQRSYFGILDYFDAHHITERIAYLQQEIQRHKDFHLSFTEICAQYNTIVPAILLLALSMKNGIPISCIGEFAIYFSEHREEISLDFSQALIEKNILQRSVGPILSSSDIWMGTDLASIQEALEERTERFIFSKEQKEAVQSSLQKMMTEQETKETIFDLVFAWLESNWKDISHVYLIISGLCRVFLSFSSVSLLQSNRKDVLKRYLSFLPKHIQFEIAVLDVILHNSSFLLTTLWEDVSDGITAWKQIGKQYLTIDLVMSYGLERAILISDDYVRGIIPDIRTKLRSCGIELRHRGCVMTFLLKELEITQHWQKHILELDSQQRKEIYLQVSISIIHMLNNTISPYRDQEYQILQHQLQFFLEEQDSSFFDAENSLERLEWLYSHDPKRRAKGLEYYKQNLFRSEAVFPKVFLHEDFIRELKDIFATQPNPLSLGSIVHALLEYDGDLQKYDNFGDTFVSQEKTDCILSEEIIHHQCPVVSKHTWSSYAKDDYCPQCLSLWLKWKNCIFPFSNSWNKNNFESSYWYPIRFLSKDHNDQNKKRIADQLLEVSFSFVAKLTLSLYLHNPDKRALQNIDQYLDDLLKNIPLLKRVNFLKQRVKEGHIFSRNEWILGVWKVLARDVERIHKAYKSVVEYSLSSKTEAADAKLLDVMIVLLSELESPLLNFVNCDFGLLSRNMFFDTDNELQDFKDPIFVYDPLMNFLPRGIFLSNLEEKTFVVLYEDLKEIAVAIDEPQPINPILDIRKIIPEYISSLHRLYVLGHQKKKMSLKSSGIMSYTFLFQDFDKLRNSIVHFQNQSTLVHFLGSNYVSSLLGLCTVLEELLNFFAIQQRFANQLVICETGVLSEEDDVIHMFEALAEYTNHPIYPARFFVMSRDGHSYEEQDEYIKDGKRANVLRLGGLTFLEGPTIEPRIYQQISDCIVYSVLHEPLQEDTKRIFGASRLSSPNGDCILYHQEYEKEKAQDFYFDLPTFPIRPVRSFDLKRMMECGLGSFFDHLCSYFEKKSADYEEKHKKDVLDFRKKLWNTQYKGSSLADWYERCIAVQREIEKQLEQHTSQKTIRVHTLCAQLEEEVYSVLDHANEPKAVDAVLKEMVEENIQNWIEVLIRERDSNLSQNAILKKIRRIGSSNVVSGHKESPFLEKSLLGAITGAGLGAAVATIGTVALPVVGLGVLGGLFGGLLGGIFGPTKEEKLRSESKKYIQQLEPKLYRLYEDLYPQQFRVVLDDLEDLLVRLKPFLPEEKDDESLQKGKYTER